jgi:hypothetical protein
MAMWTVQGPHKKELRWNGMEMMWSEVAQVVVNEKGAGIDRKVSGI